MALLRCKYAEAIEGSFKAGAAELDERERLVLGMRCDDDFTGKDIAKMLGLHPAQISRVGKKAEAKFRTRVVECLNARYNLSATAINECLTEIGNNRLPIADCCASELWPELTLISRFFGELECGDKSLHSRC